MTTKRMAALVLLPVLAALLVACSSWGSSSPAPTSPSQSATGSVTSLAGTAWTLVPASLGVPLPTGVSVTADFTATNVSGSSGCNSYSGPYTATEMGSLNFGPLSGTMKPCPSAASVAEQAYRAALAKVGAYTIYGDTLTLSDSSGAALLRYTATSATASP